MTAKNEWEMSILVPDQAQAATGVANLRTERGIFGNHVAKIDAKDVEAQWSNTLDILMNLTSQIGAKTQDWYVDSVEVGLTLSAKGELLFIAEAGAEASIKLSLKKHDAKTQPAKVA